MKNRTLKIIIVVLVLAFIWGQSVVPKNMSGRESAWLTNKIINPVLRFFGLKSISGSVVRKAAHMTEFAALSFFTCTLFTDRVKNMGKILLFCFFAAFIDETIQIFSSRGPEIMDVWIDTAGAVIGMLLGLAFLRSGKKKTK